MCKGLLIFLLLITSGCGLSSGPHFWYHPERTLEQAEQDIEQCYEQAFLAEPGIRYSPELGHDTTRRMMYVEMAARQCMRQAGYNRLAEKELDPAAKKRTGAVHGVNYYVAGQQQVLRERTEQ